MLLLLLSLAWLAGSGSAAIGMPPWIAPAAAVLACWWGRQRAWSVRLLVGVALGAVSFGGAEWYLHRQPHAQATDVSRFIGGGPTRVRGVVNGDRDLRESALVLHLDVTSVQDDRGLHRATGALLVRLPLSLPYEDGDLLEVRGKLTSPPQSAEFDYRAYLAREGVYAEVDYPSTRLIGHGRGQWFRHTRVWLRDRLDQGITTVLPQPEASLGAGIALGTRRIVDRPFNQALISTDAALIAVATGYNVTIIGMSTFSGLAWLIGRRHSALLAIAVMLAYAVVVGGYPSVLRAAVMGSVVLLAAIFGRPNGARRALVIACAVMVAIEPRALLSLSFPLCLAATAGVIWWAEPAGQAIRRLLGSGPAPAHADGWRGAVADNAATTLTALGPSLPILAVASHSLSLSALPANALLFPLVPAITLLSAATAISGALWHPAALIFAVPTYLLLAAMAAVVRLCAGIPGSQLRLDWFGPAFAVGVYATVGIGIWGAKRGSTLLERLVATVPKQLNEAAAAIRGEVREIVAAGGLARETGWPRLEHWRGVALVAASSGAILGLGLAKSVRQAPAQLELTYLDVGAGSAILLEAGSQRVLVDGGPPGEATVSALDRVLPPWDRRLNLLVISDPAAGHIGGLPAVLKRYQVGGVLDGTAGYGARAHVGPAWQAMDVALKGSGVKPVAPSVRTVVRVGDASVIIIPPDSIGPRVGVSVTTVEAVVGRRRLLLAGDPLAGIPADVRSVSGASESTPRAPARIEFLEAGDKARADAALVSLPEALRSALVYRTIEDGTVVLEVAKHEIRVRTERGPRLGLFARLH